MVAFAFSAEDVASIPLDDRIAIARAIELLAASIERMATDIMTAERVLAGARTPGRASLSRPREALSTHAR